MTKVFISYSHDSDEHRGWVLSLSERLRADGVETILDRYVENGSPPGGWPRWMLDSLDAATHVLCVCSETYYCRFRGFEVPGKGKGVDWEGTMITQELYNARSVSIKFIAVLRNLTDEPYIPEPLRPRTHYVLNTEASYQALYDALLNQGNVEPGRIGEPKTKPRAVGTPLTFGMQPQKTVSQVHTCDKKFLYHLGNLNQIQQRDHFISHVPWDACLSNGKTQGFIVAGSKQELPEIIVFTLSHLLKEILENEGIQIDTPGIKKLETGLWKMYEKKPEEFLWKRFNFILENAQAIKSLEDRKDQIKFKFENERTSQIFYREIPGDEAKNHDFLLSTLSAWSNLDLQETSPSHFLLLVCDTDLLGDRDTIEQWKAKLDESLKQQNLLNALLPPQKSPSINEDLTNWMIFWDFDLSLREQIYSEFIGTEEIPLITLKNKLCAILKDYQFNRN